MSDYVEARYALLVLRQAYCSSDAVARDLMLKLVTDLCPHYIPAPGPKGSKRTEALEALRSLALCFDHHVWPPAAYWESAHEAAQDWLVRQAASEGGQSQSPEALNLAQGFVDEPNTPRSVLVELFWNAVPKSDSL
jgi:hypothetical protein